MSAPDLIAYLVGPSEDRRRSRPSDRRDGGWRVNANNMRLSVTAHVRAMHRRAMVTSALADGVRHFMLDVPKRRRGHIAPDGVCGRNLWRVRTWEEWLDVQAKANSGRIASSGFDTLGLGYGDCTYLVPIPRVYIEDAKRYGLEMRAKHMGAPQRLRIVGAA